MPTPRRTRLALTLLLGLSAVLVPLVALGASAAATGTPAAPAGYWPDEDGGRLLFLAVLEGLFRDGVQDAAVDAVLDATDATTSAGAPPSWEQHLSRTLFVPGCSLCAPVSAAFQTYRARGSFGIKDWPAGRTRDAFGPGLSEVVVARLVHPDRTVRLTALQALVTSWVDEGLARRRATDAERVMLARWMADARKEGMAQLTRLRAEEPDLAARWPTCASCEGAVVGTLGARRVCGSAANRPP